MLALLDRVGERAITETGRFAQENEIAAVDDVFIGVEPGENAPLYAPWTPAEAEETELTLIPYFAWNNRGKGEMRVWLTAE